MSMEGHWPHLGGGRSGVSPVTQKLVPPALRGCLARQELKLPVGIIDPLVFSLFGTIGDEVVGYAMRL